MLALGCGGEVEQSEVTALRCSGTLPDSPVIYIYRAEALGGEPLNSEVRVTRAGEAAENWSATAEVAVDLDWRGERNGGAFLFRPLGTSLNVEYWDQDGDVFWTMPGCFD